jgi:3-oxoadipate enol-lactonase
VLQDRDVPTRLGRLRVRVAGEGPVMVFWPSLLMDGLLWKSQAAYFSGGHTVVLALLTAAARPLGGIRPPLTGRALDAFVGPTTRRERPEVVTTVTEALRRADVRSVSWAVKSVVPRRPDQRELFGSIRVPVLVVAGAEDATFPVAEARAMADAIPGARLHVLENTAHLAALENPDQVNALIEDFIRESAQASSGGAAV